MTEKHLFTSEQSKILSTLLDRKYAGSIGVRYFDVECSKDDETVYLKVTLRDAKGSYVYPVEARMNYKDQDLSMTEARDFLLDYVDAYFEEYLDGEETYLTIDWSNYDCDGYDLQMKGQILNAHLEYAADELISGHRINLENLSGRILN
jgi:hypothetical protein